MWDVEKGEAVVTLDGFGGLVQDFDWNVDGSLLATSSKVPACYGTLVSFARLL